MKRRIRILCLVLMGIVVCSILPPTSEALAASANAGSCGENVSWTLDSRGTLTIRGNGDMSDFDIRRDIPWNDRVGEIKEIIIDFGVTSIGELAFYRCENATSVSIPSSVTKISDKAFTYCSSLKTLSIPDSVTSIGTWAFQHCTGLLSVEIPSSIINIGNWAFQDCASLKEVTIPGSIVECGTAIFGDCKNLTNVHILDGLTVIEHTMFRDCTNLQSISIPASVTSIEPNAFIGCNHLSDVYFGGTANQWSALKISVNNESLTSASIHYSDLDNVAREPSDSQDEYIYGAVDPTDNMSLPVELLQSVDNIDSAVSAVNGLIRMMTDTQKASATGVDLATLYAETASAKAASSTTGSSDITISASTIRGLGESASQANQGVESALVSGGINTARTLSNTITFVTSASDISIQIDPDVLTTNVDKVRIETPSYAITFKLADIEPDLTHSLTFAAQDMGTGYAAGSNSGKTTVKVGLPNGRTTNAITVSLPSDSGDTTYQAVVSTDGQATASKYNPATTTMDGKINTSGTYTVKSNEKDFTDIANKSAEMQTAIRYLASKGIINGTTATTFSPDGSISRAEIATLLVKALGKLDSTATASFSDVLKGNWYYTAAASSQRHGLINGYEDNTFRGDTNISKVQIVAVSSRVLTKEMGYKTPSNPSIYLNKYKDSIDSWAQSEVALATKENLVVYRTDGTFSGNKNMTRGDAAIIIYRLFQRIW